MKDIDITYGEYASKWGIADFYEESEEKLKSALESGEDFDTGWFGCKKEIRYARLKRCGEEFTIEVSAHMDDLWDADDLIYDALWTVSKSEEELPEDIIDSIRDACIDDGIDDHSIYSETIPSAEATFEKVVEIMEKLESMAEKNNKKVFNRLCDIVKAHKEIPVDAYRFVDVYGDGLERLKRLLEDNGYVVVADIYTYGMPLSLSPFDNYGWTSLDGAEEKYDEHYKCSYIQLPMPKPMEELGI